MRTPRAVSSSTKAAAALAAVSVCVAIWFSLQPRRIGDLWRVTGWASQWLGGSSLYGPDSDVDYPPWAIVTLSPLAMVPASMLPVLWIVCNLAALVFVARRLSRDRADVFFLLIAAGTVRTLNQFSLVTLAFAVAGTTSVGRLSPLWLGLSLMKPQVGAVFWLHALWQRQWKLAAAACAVPLVLAGVFAMHAHVSILSLPQSYAQSIALQYGAPFWGQTEITTWLRELWPALSAVVLTVVVAAVVFAPLARRQTHLGLTLASLLALRHLSYDLILLLPCLATTSGVVLWIGTGFLMADPSAIARVLAPGSWLAFHADRITLVLLWVTIVTRNNGHEQTQ